MADDLQRIAEEIEDHLDFRPAAKLEHRILVLDCAPTDVASWSHAYYDIVIASDGTVLKDRGGNAKQIITWLASAVDQSDAKDISKFCVLCLSGEHQPEDHRLNKGGLDA